MYFTILRRVLGCGALGRNATARHANLTIFGGIMAIDVRNQPKMMFEVEILEPLFQFWVKEAIDPL